jgi:glutamate synthase (NADPH/NADH) small chain
VIDRRLDILRAEGIRFETGVEVGTDLPWAELRGAYDAVLITIGALQARDLPIAGRDLGGIHLAMDYLCQQNRVISGDPMKPGELRIDARGKRVIILGGGDTGSDCLGTAHRQGATSTMQIELMPPPASHRPSDNPWPQWPMIMRTSSSQEEGGVREFALSTKRFTGSGGQVRQLHGVRVAVERDSTGRQRVVELADTAFAFDTDLVIFALGFVGPVAGALVDQLGARLDVRGNVWTGDGFRTSVPGVYAAGDASRGASLIVWAISDGREAARSIDADLMQATERLPTRGADSAFGGR